MSLLETVSLHMAWDNPLQKVHAGHKDNMHTGYENKQTHIHIYHIYSEKGSFGFGLSKEQNYTSRDTAMQTTYR